MQENRRNRRNRTRRNPRRPENRANEENQDTIKNLSNSIPHFLFLFALFLIFMIFEWSSHAKTIKEDLRRKEEEIQIFQKEYEFRLKELEIRQTKFELQMNNQISKQNAMLNDYVAVWSGKKQKSAAKNFSVGIWYTFSNNISSNKVQIVEASGVLYKHEGKCYIVSNHHTLVAPRLHKEQNTKNSRLYDIETLIFMTKDFKTVTYHNVTFETIYFEDSFGDSMDVAAINISCEDVSILMNNDINISEVDSIPMQLYGEYINVRKKYRRPITDCSVILKDIGRDSKNRQYRKEIGTYGHTNCASIPGYSGCGLYNQYGQLVGLHVGTGYSEESRLLHMMDEEKFIKNECDSINESYSGQGVNLSDETLNKIIRVARNAFSNIVFAKNILLLFETNGHINKSDLYDETIKVI